jgi:hypothetical protein
MQRTTGKLSRFDVRDAIIYADFWINTQANLRGVRNASAGSSSHLKASRSLNL